MHLKKKPNKKKSGRPKNNSAAVQMMLNLKEEECHALEDALDLFQREFRATDTVFAANKQSIVRILIDDLRENLKNPNFSFVDQYLRKRTEN